MSKIIVIEGPDRVGKATQSRMLCDHITKELNKTATVIEVPIHDNSTYKIIYWMLGNGLARKFPKIFQWLQVANRWIFQTTKLVELEHDYDYIIFDRWSCSTEVYGAAEGIQESALKKMSKLLRAPDFTIVLLGKSHTHVAEDSYESDSSLQKRVSDIYADWASKHSGGVHVVDCENSKEKVASEVKKVLRTLRHIPT